MRNFKSQKTSIIHSSGLLGLICAEGEILALSLSEDGDLLLFFFAFVCVDIYTDVNMISLVRYVLMMCCGLIAKKNRRNL